MVKIKEYIDTTVEKLRDNIIKSTQEIIQIKSVKDKAEDNKPFGKGINKCLEKTLKIAEDIGLKSKNIDGYAGHIEIGENKEIIGILSHLDVVPEGNDWTYPPYAGEIHDGKLYGRGSIDDKGPTIAALYAMKCIQESGVKLNKRVRLILGTDEESGWEGLNYYLEKEETPYLAFTPDAEFPVIYGEKGILHIELSSNIRNYKSEKVDSIIIEGGNATNMVPDFCRAIIETDSKELIKEKLKEYLLKNKEDKIESEVENKVIIINSYGISAHGSLPEDGVNAISQLMNFLDTLNIFSDDNSNLISFYANKIGMEYNGQGMGCNFNDDVSGPLTFNVGKIDLNNNKFSITVDIRYPVTYTKSTVSKSIKNVIKKRDIKYQELSHKAPLYVKREEPLVKKLMKVYQDYTGDMSEVITIGGGTYARALEKAVAFGPLFPGQEELAHQKDEYIGIDELILITKIYALAIIELAQ